MIFGVVALLVILSVICAIASTWQPPKVQLWVAVLLLALAVLIQVWPK